MSVALALAYGSLVGVSGTGMRRPRALTAVAARPVPDIADTVVMPPLAACLGDPTPDIRVAGDWLAWGAHERALATAPDREPIPASAHARSGARRSGSIVPAAARRSLRAPAARRMPAQRRPP